MATKQLQLLLFLSLVAGTRALQVTSDSPCASLCIDKEDGDRTDPGSSNTSGDDIACNDDEYLSTTKGQKYQRCMTCLQDSDYSNGDESDQQWFLYNMRYAFDYCVFGFPNATDVGTNPCLTETACGSMEKPLKSGNLDPEQDGNYQYCDADDGSSVVSNTFKSCLSCVRAGGGHHILSNFLIALEAACHQKPPVGQVIGLNDTVFASTPIEAVDATPTGSSSHRLALPTTSIVAIALSGLVALLLLAGCIYMQYRKRVNRRKRQSPITRGLRDGRRTISSLSFRCRAHLTPMGGSFAMGHEEDGTQEESQGRRREKGGSIGLTQFQTVPEEPAAYDYDEKKHLQALDRKQQVEDKKQQDALSRQRQLEKERLQREQERRQKSQRKNAPAKPNLELSDPAMGASARPITAPAPTHSPTNTRPNLWNPHNAMSSFEGLARSASTASSKSSFSQHNGSITNFSRNVRSRENLSLATRDLPNSPQQTTGSSKTAFSPWGETPISANSNAPLLGSNNNSSNSGIKPYNPAEFGMGSPNMGPSGDVYSPSMTSTPSPLLAQERRFAHSARSPALRNLNSPTSNQNSPIISQGGWPLPAAVSARSPAIEKGGFYGSDMSYAARRQQQKRAAAAAAGGGTTDVKVPIEGSPIEGSRLAMMNLPPPPPAPGKRP